MENKYNINILISSKKMWILKGKNIVVDLESFLFIKKLILEDLEVIMI